MFLRNFLHLIAWILWGRTLEPRVNVKGQWPAGAESFASISNYVQLASEVKRQFDMARVMVDKSKRTKGPVLVEGAFFDFGPNYFLRVMVAALAATNGDPKEITVFFPGPSSDHERARILLSELGVSNLIFDVKSFNSGPISWRLFACWSLVKNISDLCSPSRLLNVNFSGILLGDLIYDDLIRESRKKELRRIGQSSINKLLKASFLVFSFRNLVSLKRFATLIVTHSTYVEYGTLVRVALQANITVLETSDVTTFVHEDFGSYALTTFHGAMRKAIIDGLRKPLQEENINRANVSKSVFPREVNQMNPLITRDLIIARQERRYSRLELLDFFQVDKELPIIMIMCHVFSDVPHCSKKSLYRDYRVWLQSTLSICKEINSGLWLVRPHPMARHYGEVGMVEEIVADCNSKNVRCAPEDLSSESIPEWAKAIVTVQGTAGLEYPCLGIPAVTTGEAFYSGLGFTIDCLSLSNYNTTLVALPGVPQLEPSKIETARRVYEAYRQELDTTNALIPIEIANSIWGGYQDVQQIDTVAGDLRSHLSTYAVPRSKLYQLAQLCNLEDL